MDVRLVVWSILYITEAYGSGCESMPVLLPGLAINDSKAR